MRDVVLIVVVIGFFSGAAAYVRGCAGIVAPPTIDEPVGRPETGASTDSDHRVGAA